MDPRARATPSQSLTDEVEWVRDLARGLVSDADLADDLAQETLLDALNARDGTVRSARGWLSVVMQRRLTDFRRKEGRFRERQELLARRSTSPPTAELVERSSVIEALVEELGSLPEHYRQTLLLRYFEGMTPKEIAESTGMPVSSVKTRLQRGLAQLRERLGERNGGDEKSWVASVVALLGADLGRAPMRTAPKLLAVAGAAVGVLTVAAFGPWWNEPPAEEVATLTPAEVSTSSPVAADEAPFDSNAGRMIVDPLEGVAPTPAADGPLVRGRVESSRGEGLAGVTLRLDELGQLDRPDPLLTTSLADGSFAFESDYVAGLVRVMDERFSTLLAGRLGDELVVVASPRRRFAGRVVDQDEREVVHARIELVPDLGVGTPAGVSLEMLAHSGLDGRFALVDLPGEPGSTLRISRSGYESLELALPEHDRLDETIELVALDPAALVFGRVVDPRRAPVPGAQVALGYDEVRTDEEGTFLLAAPTGPGPFDLRALVPGRRSAHAHGVRAGKDIHWEGLPGEVLLVVGDEPLAVAGRVVDATGAPLAGLRVWIKDLTLFKQPKRRAQGFIAESPQNLELRIDDAASFVENIQTGEAAGTWTPVYTDASGAFRLEGLDERQYTLGVLDPKTLMWLSVPAVPAGEEELEIWWDPQPVWSTVAGRVVDPRGDPVSGAQVSLSLRVLEFSMHGRTSSVSTSRTGAVTDARGEFSIPRVPKQSIVLLVRGPQILDRGRLLESMEPDAIEGLEVVVERHAPLQLVDAEHTSGESFALRDAAGQFVPMHQVDAGRRLVFEYAPIEEGRSGVFEASVSAVELVLFRGEEELEALPLVLRAGELNLVRP